MRTIMEESVDYVGAGEGVLTVEGLLRGDPLDKNYDAGDIATETRTAMAADCKAFYEAHSATWAGQNLRVDVGPDDDCAGHDFWLNRNGHGCGFWDGDWAEPAASVLSEAAKQFGEFHLCVGDDGQIWGG